MAGNYYSVLTRRFRLRTKHENWLELTENLYNDILLFYYDLFLDVLDRNGQATGHSGQAAGNGSKSTGRNGQAAGYNNQTVMRELEKLSIVGRDKQPVPYPLPFQKVPLYFRRAAINCAVAAARSLASRGNQRERTREFHESVTFYKGMYKDFTENEITLKVWDGESWRWLRCRLKGNQIPGDAEALSPSVVRKKGYIELHVPVKETVPDGRKAKERLTETDRICSVQFTNTDSFAVCAVLDREGNLLHVKFFKGGNQYRHLCGKKLERIEESILAMGGTKGDGLEKQMREGTPLNQKYWKSLANLSNHYADLVSRQLVDYCKEQKVSTVVFGKYEEDYERMIMKSAGNYSPLHLSRRIKDRVKYKAWQAGIVVMEKEIVHVADHCYLCGKKVQNLKNEFRCENGHQGNRYVNTAVNLGRRYLKSMTKGSL